MSVVASEIRRLHRKTAQLDRRLALAQISGKVHPGSQDPVKRTVRLELGRDADDQPVLSQPVRWQEAGAGSFKTHATPADNEQMTLISPSGTMGSGSLAIRGTFDADNASPSQATDAAVMSFGGTTLTLKDDGLTISSGGASLSVSAAGVTMAGGKVRHDGKNVGSDHKHLDVRSGGDLSGKPQ